MAGPGRGHTSAASLSFSRNSRVEAAAASLRDREVGTECGMGRGAGV